MTTSNNTNKTIPGKRIKSWHRGRAIPTSLRAFAHGLLKNASLDEAQIAKRWLEGKK